MYLKSLENNFTERGLSGVTVHFMSIAHPFCLPARLPFLDL